MFEKLKQIKDLRDQANQLKQKLAAVTVSAQAMGGKITIVMDGNQEIVGLDIDPAVLSAEHKEQLERELQEAFNAAGKKAKMEMARQFQQGGLDLSSFGK